MWISSAFSLFAGRVTRSRVLPVVKGKATATRSPGSEIPLTRFERRSCDDQAEAACASIVCGRTRGTCLSVPLPAFAQSMTTHDFEKARVIGETERVGSARHVPLVFLERLEHDLPLGLGF